MLLGRIVRLVKARRLSKFLKHDRQDRIPRRADDSPLYIV